MIYVYLKQKVYIYICILYGVMQKAYIDICKYIYVEGHTCYWSVKRNRVGIHLLIINS